MAIKGQSVDKMAGLVAAKVVERLQGDDRIQQVLMDEIDAVMAELGEMDEELEMDLSMLTFGRICLTAD